MLLVSATTLALTFSASSPATTGPSPCPSVTPAMDASASASACIQDAGGAQADTRAALYRQALIDTALAYRDARAGGAPKWLERMAELVHYASESCERGDDRDTLRRCVDLLELHAEDLDAAAMPSQDIRQRLAVVRRREPAAPSQLPTQTTDPIPPPLAAPPGDARKPLPRHVYAGFGVSLGLLTASGIVGSIGLARFLDARADVEAVDLGPPGTENQSVCTAGLAEDACSMMYRSRATFLTSAIVFTASTAALTAASVLIGRHRKRAASTTSFHAIPTRGGVFAGLSLRF